MRCPKCKFISADKRDLCPKCLLDLRPEKKRLGLPITRPKTSYEDLIKLAKNKKTKSKKTKPEEDAPIKAVAATDFVKEQQIAALSDALSPAIQKKKPIWSRLLTKFTFSTSKKRIVVEEKITVTSLAEESDATQSKTAPAIAPALEAKIGVDEKAFESLFEELPSEPSDEDFLKLGQEMSMKLAQAMTSTELLRELPTTAYVSQISQATPEVVEFDEHDDALLEEQLNQLLGDDIVEISSVKVPKKATPAPQANSIKVDDLEISFEFDVESDEADVEADQEANEIQEAPSFETKSINQLEAALLALDAEFNEVANTLEISDDEELSEDATIEELDTLESLKNDLLGLEDGHQERDDDENFDLSILKGTIPAKLKQSPQELSNYLMHLLADTVGCRPEELFRESQETLVETPSEETFDETDLEEEALVESVTEDDAQEKDDDDANDEGEGEDEAELEALFNTIEPDENAPLKPPSLWDLAEAELGSSEFEGEELEINQLVSYGKRDELLVLFDAAIAALEDTKLEEAYKTKIKISENKQLEADDLAIVFERFGEAAVEDHKQNFNHSKSSRASKPQQALPPIDFPPIELIPLTKAAVFILLMKSAGIGLALGAAHLWFFDLMSSARESILSHQLVWLVLPHLAKNLAMALILSSIVFFFWYKNQRNSINDAPLTL